MGLEIEAVFALEGVSAAEMWKLVAGTHTEVFSEGVECDLYGRALKASNVARAIERKGKPHFEIEFADTKIGFGAVRNNDLSLIYFEGCVGDDHDASRWLAPLLTLDAFVHARLYDQEYDFWQNASDPLQYKVKGRSLQHVKVYRDELLNYDFIDTSSNPGRRVMKQGYIEALGHVMWFSPKFWALVHRAASEMAERNVCLSASKMGEIDILRFSDKPFTRPTGEEGLLQNRLRGLLFPL